MIDPRAAKFITKGVIGVGISLVLGAVLRLERNIDEHIDARYEELHGNKNDPDPSDQQ